MMKYCPRCQTQRNKSEFYKNKARHDGLQSWCKGCLRVYDRRRYADRSDQRHASRKKLRKSKYKLVAGLKAAQGCSRCPEDDSRCLHLHHVNPEEKTMSISEMVNHGCTVEAIKEEMTKCIILCANCHFKEHIDDYTT